MSQLRYAVVGTGHRAQMYVDAITDTYADRAALVALCEPNPVRADVYAQRVAGKGLPTPSVWTPDRLEDMIRAERIERVVICSRAVAARTTDPISLLLPDAAYYGGDGKNVVNVLLVDIRAWDTMGEISVLLVAATGVASLVFRTRRFGTAPRVADAPAAQLDAVSASNETTWLLGGDLIDPRYRSLVLEVTTRLVFPTMMILSVYFFFSGHNAPGGGFAGGLVAGLALVLRYLAGGRYELGEAVPIDAGKILGLGLTFAAGTALVSMFLGAPALSSATLELTLPLLGDIKIVTALFFDLGVYLIVVGLILDVLRSLGARLDAETVGERR